MTIVRQLDGKGMSVLAALIHASMTRHPMIFFTFNRHFMAETWPKSQRGKRLLLGAGRGARR